MTFRQGTSGTNAGRMWLCAAATIIGLLGIGAASARGQCEAAKLMASDGEYNDRFGRWVDVSGDVAIAGAWYESEMGEYAGAAYVFRLDGAGWPQEAKLLAPDGAEGDKFGSAVGVSGDCAIVGASHLDLLRDDVGAVYIFRYEDEAWSCETQIILIQDDEHAYFGKSVDIEGDVIIVGRPGWGVNDQSPGAACVYRFDGSTWAPEAWLVDPDPIPRQEFGSDVAMSGDVVIVGSEDDDDLAQNAGSASIFRYDGSTWVHEAKLLASDGVEDDVFGRFVDINGDVAIVGAPEHDANGSRSGAAYIFRRQGAEWVEEAKLLASDGNTFDSFGSCAIREDSALVGAYSADGNAHNSGAAYLFRFDGASWMEERKIVASDGRLEAWLGFGVAMDGERAIIGANGDSEMAQTAGAAYVFDFEGEDCNENGICDGRDILEGTSCDINGNGIPDECEDLCTGDVNADGEVDVADLNDLVGMWGPCVPGEACLADFHCDGTVNVRDLLILLGHWGPCPDRGAAPR